MNDFILKIFISIFFVFLLQFSAQAESQWSKFAPIQPIPLDDSQSKEVVLLGKQLFEDNRLSKDNIFSCSDCHQLSQGGDDGLARSMTNKGEVNIINTPTVFNARYNFKQTWEGFFGTLEEQVEGDILYKDHGNSSWPEVLGKLKGDTAYQKLFFDVYEDGITRENILNAIATYERSLITPNSRFDKYMRGDTDAITGSEKLGYRYFKEYGCIACHQGVNVGGNMYQKFGLFGDYFKNRGNVQVGDYGLYNITGKEEDRFVFRVPSLRNVAVTSPYLHDGSVESGRDVIKVMAKYQLGTTIPDERIDYIVSFLKTLTGEYQGKLLTD